MIKAIIFDFDGTILDTETAWFHALKKGYQQYDAELSLDQYSQCIGTHQSSFDPYENIVKAAKQPVDVEAFRLAVKDHYESFMKQELIREGVLDWLKQAKAAGIRIGLATSSHRAWIDKYAGELGIIDYFDGIRTADDVKQVKPDPELYLKVIEDLGVKPEEAVVVEDSPNGVRAAVAAGIKCIVTPNPITRELAFDESPLCYFADSLADIDFEAMTGGMLRHSGKR